MRKLSYFDSRAPPHTALCYVDFSIGMVDSGCPVWFTVDFAFLGEVGH